VTRRSELSSAPGQLDALVRRCDAAKPGELTVDATLSTLVVSPELATRVRLSDVRIAEVTAAAG